MSGILDSQPTACFNGGMDTVPDQTATVDDADIVAPIPTRSPNVRDYEAQGVLQPGDEGWWQLWGARPMHLQAGDLFCWKPGDGSGSVSPWLEVDRCEPTMFGMKVWTVNEVDQRPWSIGDWCIVAVVRRGTHNMLAD